MGAVRRAAAGGTGLLLGVALTASAGLAPAAAGPAAITPLLLPASQPDARASDINEAGVVAGFMTPTGLADPMTNGGTVQRWLPTAEGGYVRRALPLPAGATGARSDGLTPAGEAAGTVGTAEGLIATRWELRSGQPRALGGPGTGVVAAGAGEWLVISGGPAFTTAATTLVRRDGTTVPIAGLPELAGTAVRGLGLGRPGTALVSVQEGLGRAATQTPTLWQDGAAVRFPVFAGPLVGRACTAEPLADGTTAYSGPTATGRIAGVHVGGVPGREVALPSEAGREPRLGCEPLDTTADLLAADGTVAGSLIGPGDTEEAAVWRRGRLVTLGVGTGEQRTQAVAAATGGRVVVVATLPDGGRRLSLWRDGVRVPLTIPAGWQLQDVVGITDRGVVLANLSGDSQTTRPAVWFTGSR